MIIRRFLDGFTVQNPNNVIKKGGTHPPNRPPHPGITLLPSARPGPTVPIRKG